MTANINMSKTQMFFDAITNIDHEKILDFTLGGLLNMKKKFRYQKKNRALEADEMSALLLTIKYCYRRDIIENMIASGADVNAVGYEYAGRNFNRERRVTPLYLAINRMRNTELVQCLISAGADLNKFAGQVTETEEEGGSMVLDCRSSSLNFALHSQFYDPEVIEILLENGADHSIKNDSSLFPLQVATLYNYSESVLSLVRYCGCASSDTYSEYSPLVLLLDSAELLYPDEELGSPQRCAEKRYHLMRCVKILLNGGYDVLNDSLMVDLCQRSKCEEDTDEIVLNVCNVINDWVYQPKNLKVLCRLRIRHILHGGQTCNPRTVHQLPLPKTLNNYLNFCDFE